jgi:hypothetical protein
MDLQTQLFQALKFGGGAHFLTLLLLERWRKKNDLKSDPTTGLLQYPTSTTDTGITPYPGSTTPPAKPGQGPQAGFTYTLYSLDSSLGADAALSVAAALLIPSSAAAGTSTPSTPALAGGSGGAAVTAALAGYVVGNALA